jgi:hypothetical protein
MQAPVVVISKSLISQLSPYCLPANHGSLTYVDTNMERETGRKAQVSNITAAKVHPPTSLY